jgi:hypothetical protein
MGFPDPAYCDFDRDDECHRGPEKPMLFQIRASTQRSVAGEEVNFSGNLDQYEDQQAKDFDPVEPLPYPPRLAGQTFPRRMNLVRRALSVQR